MSFAAPAFLALVLLVPLAVLAARLARRLRAPYAIRFPAAATLAGVSHRVPAWRRLLAPVLLATAVICLALALARPHTTVAVPIEKASAMLVTDASGSMMANDVSPTRLDAARKAAKRFIERAGSRLQIGIVGYASVPHTVVDPLVARGPILQALDSLQADGGTATGDALQVALDRIATTRKRNGAQTPAAIVLLSDGKNTDGADPVEVARKAAAAHVRIYTVALGTPDGTVIQGNGPFAQTYSVPPDPETLAAIAHVSGGRSFAVSDAGDLDRIYSQLGSQVGTRKRSHEVTQSFAGAALLLLLAGAGAGLRRRGALP